MVVVGLAAAGSAGKASANFCLDPDDALAAGVLLTGAVVVRTLAVPAEDGDAAQGVWPGLAPTRPDGGGRAGKGLLDDAVDQLACWLAVDRDDLAVELFNFNTRDPPCAVAPPIPGAEPGSDG
jgi:hypothetical protein